MSTPKANTSKASYVLKNGHLINRLPKGKTLWWKISLSRHNLSDNSEGIEDTKLLHMHMYDKRVCIVICCDAYMD